MFVRCNGVISCVFFRRIVCGHSDWLLRDHDWQLLIATVDWPTVSLNRAHWYYSLYGYHCVLVLNFFCCSNFLIFILNFLQLIPGYRGLIIDSLRSLTILDDLGISADEKHHFKGPSEETR